MPPARVGAVDRDVLAPAQRPSCPAPGHPRRVHRPDRRRCRGFVERRDRRRPPAGGGHLRHPAPPRRVHRAVRRARSELTNLRVPLRDVVKPRPLTELARDAERPDPLAAVGPARAPTSARSPTRSDTARGTCTGGCWRSPDTAPSASRASDGCRRCWPRAGERAGRAPPPVRLPRRSAHDQRRAPPRRRHAPGDARRGRGVGPPSAGHRLTISSPGATVLQDRLGVDAAPMVGNGFAPLPMRSSTFARTGHPAHSESDIWFTLRVRAYCRLTLSGHPGGGSR